jgi:GTP-binding protein
MDLPDVSELEPLIQEMLAERGIQVRAISAVTGKGVQELLWEIVGRLSELPDEIPAESIPESVVIGPQADEKAFTIAQDEEGWHVRGIAIERTAAMTQWEQYESLARVQRILEAMGITLALREAGVQDGDTVFIGDAELQWGWPEE